MILLPHFDSEIKIPRYVVETHGVTWQEPCLAIQHEIGMQFTFFDQPLSGLTNSILLMLIYRMLVYHNQISNKSLIYKFLTNNF